MRISKPSFSDIFKTTAHQIERRYDWLRVHTKKFFGLVEPVIILPYRGYGNSTQWYLLGRVQEDKEIRTASVEDSWWKNGLAMYRRFTTSEIPDVQIRAEAFGQTLETKTDSEGYFRFHFNLPEPIEDNAPWKPVELELFESPSKHQDKVHAQGQVLVPAAGSRFGVISDVDDTIIESHATDFFKLAKITFTNNALTRTPLPGVSRLYRSLEAATDGQAVNPFFYVSSSAWNIYDLIEQFLDVHDIPAGPILLQDLGIDNEKFIKSGHDHKLDKIEAILRTCHKLPFVLIGDAGQQDPVIYREVVRRHPGRVLAIYIRTVGSQKRNNRVRQMVKESSESDVPMLLIDQVDQALEHAASIGLLQSATVSPSSG